MGLVRWLLIGRRGDDISQSGHLRAGQGFISISTAFIKLIRVIASQKLLRRNVT